MSDRYVIVDTDINRVVGTRETQKEALVYVARLLKTNGDDYADELAVGLRTDDDNYVDVLSGAALLARVRAVVAEREGTAARPQQVAPS